MYKNKTKLVCTIGPSSWEKKTLLAMAREGMDVVRLNMAHGDYDSHAKTISLLREVAKEIGKPLAIEVDLQGPKIRVGELPEKGLELVPGDQIVFSTDPKLAKVVAKELPEDRIFVQYPNLHKDVEVGARLLLADGKMGVKVMDINGYDIVCEVVTGGILKSHKGLNFPDTTLSVPTITDKDKADLEFAIKQDVEWVGLSFVRAPEDMLELKALIDKLSKGKTPPTLVTSKIETHEAIDNLNEIIKDSDGVVIARGDLGPEVSLTSVPKMQKDIILACRGQMKPVIVATQMLYSMVENPRPTRAEVSDVANAVFDNVDAIYLSDETASGKYPLEAVSMATSIIRDAEKSAYDDVKDLGELVGNKKEEPLVALARHAAMIAKDIKAKAIIITTISGQTAVAVSSARQPVPIIAVTDHKKVQRQLSFVWGVYPHIVSNIVHQNTVTEEIKDILASQYNIKKGDQVVFVDGVRQDKSEGSELVSVIEID